ncbi:septal ring lytic transglycosylase RlpA family protein [Campylobacter blaseri]|uniref:Probable endolytic peptidoglycan transglycosylase RlpA n=2 Tax=Campylobacter blaseri TaxID=2042961 RepID=A0A2P8R042_9BACT|nr:septal ring lytic transglycosylase RlpA family protein [Campylobacter blaseri]PSM51869.1 septal ring lytic transglycosylase RlpA family lipoprotein [Campylobacter blaseri]PSM53660.1 septal ring lytic transglycosylase RlpA family lipoprotein [Campylobacter blaseri]
MRPYTINGKTYYPTTVKVGDIQRGLASWYGPNFHGKSTSNGEKYNMYAQTAAHKTYPMNTMVKVTNLNNSKSAIVRINDRGPFVKGRIIDLSKKVANDLGVIATGTAPVILEVVGFHGHQISKTAPSSERVYTGGVFMVQVGAFRRLEGANIYKNKYDGTGGYSAVVREFELDRYPIYRVFLTGFRSEEEARDFAYNTHISGAFITRQ